MVRGLLKLIRESLLKKTILISFVLSLILTSCSGTSNLAFMETSEAYIPPAANQFAMDKENEVETIEPTLAHRPYPSDFTMPIGGEVTIGEKQFLTRINYIYNNIEKFENTKIIVEGMYGEYTSWDGTFTFPMVYRNGPSEYGDDQYGGFYLVNVPTEYLNIDDWIKVKGTPFMYEHTDSEGEVQKYLFLLAETCEVLPTKERKAEMVND